MERDQMNGFQWLYIATRGIRFRPDREAARAELAAHLEDKQADLQRIFPDLSPEEAEHMMSRKDWERKSYHNYYCKGKWGDSRNYDLSINSSRLGVEGTVDLLETYIRARMDA